jgi:hypothetical protein
MGFPLSSRTQIAAFEEDANGDEPRRARSLDAKLVPQRRGATLLAILRRKGMPSRAVGLVIENVNRTGFPGGNFAWVGRRWPDRRSGHSGQN